MPKLPDKMDLGAPGGQSRSLALAPSDWPDTSNAPVIGAALKGVGQIAATLQAKVDEADDYEVQKAIVEFDLEQEKRLDESKRSAEPEAKGFTDGYRSSYDESARNLMTRIPGRLKPKVDEILVKRGASFEKRAYDFELAERDRWNVQDVNKNTSELVTRSMSNPDLLEDNAARGVALIRSSRLSQRAKVEAERKFLDMNAEYGIQAMIDRKIEAGEDAADLIEKLRKIPRGATPGGAGPVGTVGSVSEKYESAGKGVGFVSTGNGDPGGPSYGRHQLSSKDSMPAFLKSQEGSAYADRFKGLRPGTPAFNQAYSEVAREDPEGLAKAQYDFYDRTHYRPVLDHAKSKGIQVEDRGVQEALFSIAVQHGGAKKIVDAAMRKAGSDPDAQIRALYEARGRYVQSLSDLPPETKASVLNRYKGEMRDALALSGQPASSQGSEVERKPLPAPGEVVKDEPSGDRIEAGEDGTPKLVKGDNRTDIPSGPKLGEVTTSSDEFEEADDAGWAYLTPQTRRKLINYARTAGRAVVTKGVDDDIARLRLGKEPATGGDGRTSLERARSHMTNMQWAKKKQEWTRPVLSTRRFLG